MQRYRELMTICCAAVLSLGLAACGGSGGGDDDQTMMMCPAGQIGTYPDCSPAPEPEPEPVAVSVPDADYLDEDNMPAAETLTIAAGMTATSGGVTFLCAEGGDACEVTIDEDGMATATGGTVTASLTAAAMTQVAETKEMMADEEEAARLVRVKRVIGEDGAIEGVDDLARTANTTGLDATEIRISRAQGGTARVRVVPSDAGETGVGGYVPAEDPAMANGDWAGVRLERPVGGATQQLVVYTDIEQPTKVQFYNFDGRTTTASRYGGHVSDAATGTAATDPTEAVPYTRDTPIAAVTLGGTGGQAFTGGVLDLTQFPSRGPAAGGDVRKRFPVNLNSNPDTNTTPDTVSFRGNYNGAPGTYTCLPGGTATENGACTVSVTPAGAYSSVTAGDTWTFTPELGATAFDADGEFVRFGWWLQTPRSPDGTYTFNTWFHGVDYVVAGIPVGSATYAGRAAGRYAMQELGAAGVVDGSSGEFTAAASLTATFSPTANMISGTVNGFQGNGDADMSGWEVTLNRINIGATTNLATAFATTVTDPTRSNFNGATATMGDQTAHGTWNGQFFGNDQTDGETPANINNAFPGAVGGSFRADNEAVSIAGAFGAHR